MNKHHLAACMAIVTASLTGAGPAAALELQTFVSALNGNNSNSPCLRAAPCRSIGTAINNTESGGTVTLLDDGTYPSVSVSKHITIEGQGPSTRIINQGSNVGVNIASNLRVALRNLSVDGALADPGNIGIGIGGGSAVSVENVTISNQLNVDASGILLLGANSELHLKNVSISNSGGSGTGGAIVIANGTAGSSYKVYIEDSTIEHNWRGIVISGSSNTFVSISNSAIVHSMDSTAVLIQPSGGTTKLSIKDSQVVNNSGTGVLIAPTGSAKVNTTVVGSAFDGNVIGIRSFPASPAVSNLTISDTSMSNNAGGIHASGKSTVGIIRGSIGGNSSYGVGAASPAAVRIGGSVVNGNTLGFSGPVNSYGNNQLLGNTTQGASTPVAPAGMP